MKLVCLLAALASSVAACDDDIVDLDLPKDASTNRDGAASDAPAADVGLPEGAAGDGAALDEAIDDTDATSTADGDTDAAFHSGGGDVDASPE